MTTTTVELPRGIVDDPTRHLFNAEIVDGAVAAYNDQTAVRLMAMQDGADAAEDDRAAGQSHRAGLAAAATHAHRLGTLAAQMQALEAFAAAYARTGQPCDPDMVEQLTKELAATAEVTYRRVQDALVTGDFSQISSPVVVLTNLLAVVSATRVALGFAPTPVISDIQRAIAMEDVTTPAAAGMRLHLLSVHGNVNALNASDRVAGLMHAAVHRGDTIDVSDLPWNEAGCRDVIADLPPEDQEALSNALAAELARYEQAERAAAEAAR